MNRFLVFHRHRGFNWSKRTILNFVLLGCGAMFIIKHLFLDNTYFVIDKTILWIAVIAFLCKIVLRLLPGGVYQDLNGFMDGFLMVDDHKITIYENEYFFTDIKSIEVSAPDYSGKYIEGSRYTVGIYSNGVDNYLKLNMRDGKVIRAEFQQMYANTFKETVETLVPDSEIHKFVFFEAR